MKINQFLDHLTNIPAMPNVENLYDIKNNEGKVRRNNLEIYLRTMAELKPKVAIIGEAPGYLGTRRTGVPFASEFTVNGGMQEVPFFTEDHGFKLAYNNGRIYKEPTSTVMWRTISQFKELPLLWAAFPLHPHQPGNLESNRTPTVGEARQFEPLLKEFLALFDVDQVLALGNIAHKTLGHLGMDAQKVRHPSHGGARIFERQLQEILA